jgi:hypothetical protein
MVIPDVDQAVQDPKGIRCVPLALVSGSGDGVWDAMNG